MYEGALPPVSNRADWPSTHGIQLFDDETGEVIDLTTADEITMEIRDPASLSTVLSATLSGGGIVIQATNVAFPVDFTAARMSTLDAKNYEIGVTAEVGGQVIQLIIGTLPVRDGIVR